MAADLKVIYRAETAEMAEARLAEFEEKWDDRYPSIGQSWRRNWEKVIPFFAFPQDIRRIIYTTDEIDKPFVSEFSVYFGGTGDHGAKSGLRTGRPAARPDHNARSFVAPVRRQGPFGRHPVTYF